MSTHDSAASLPTYPYKIFRDQHGIPQFEPKRGTQALKDALAYAFPTLETELQLMQAALRKFFDAERGSKFVFELRQNDLQTSLSKPKDTEICPIQAGKSSLKSWKQPVGQRRGSRASSRASSRPPSRPPSRALSRVSSRAETPSTRPSTPSDGIGGGKMTTWILSSGQELEGRKKAPYDPVKRRKVAENRGNVCDKHRASKTMCDPELCPDNKAYSKPAETSKDAIDLVGSFRSLPTVKEIKKSDMDSIFSSTPDAAISDAIHIDNAPEQADLFWEALEQPDLTFDDSDLSSWADISHTNSHSTPSWTNHAANSDLLLAASTIGDCAFENKNEGGGPEVGYHEQSLPLSHQSLGQGFTAPLLETAGQFQQGPMSSLQGRPVEYSEDPFMGWTSKRASQMCEDYGWVLSHVGTL